MNTKSVLSICASALVLTLAAGVASDAARADAIDCNTTPFGKGVRVVQDEEFISLHDGSAGKEFGEFRLPFAGETDALVPVYNGDPQVPNVTKFLTATNVDLNGDGRDEIAAVYRGGGPAYGALVIVIFERTPGFTPSAQILGTWSVNLNNWNGSGAGFFDNSVALTAGDFIGSKTRQQQLALMWRSFNGNDHGGDLNVLLLTGAADGSIAQASNTWAGRWESPIHKAYDQASLTHGDFLLDGRDQIAVVSAQNQTLYYDLLEFNGGGSSVPVNSGLPINNNGVDSAIGSKEFASDISKFTDDAFDGTKVGGSTCQLPPCVESVLAQQEPDKIVASGGDMVDSAADELVVHVSFLAGVYLVGGSGSGPTYSNSVGQMLGQRLVHFATTQVSPGGDISTVQLASSGTGRDFDFSQILGARAVGGTDFPASEVTTADFDAAVGAVDAQEKRSVALVHVVGGNQLETDVYKASVRLNAAFQFTVHAATGPFPVDFTNTSTGDVQGVSWDFGDNSTSIAVNPVHNYNSTGTYTVKLTVTDSNNKVNTYSTSVSINGAASTAGTAARYTYQMTTTPAYSAATANPVDFLHQPTQCYNFDTGAAPHIAIGDMDRDGFAEIMTTAQSIQFTPTNSSCALNQNSTSDKATIWRSLWRIDPTTYAFSGTHAQQVTATGITASLPYSSAATVAGDFDGDSTFATLGSDCRAVSEPQLRNLIWMPPFFAALQSGALNNGNMSASFGINEKSGSSVENRSGSFTGNSISAYFGGSIGTPDSASVHVRATLKAHAGHEWQSEHGAIHGEDTETDYSEGQAATVGDGLVVAEADSANCFSYDVVQSTGLVPNSAMRMCQITYQERTAETADTWNAQYDYAQTSPNWAPVQRDWASLALFRPATSTVPFTVGKQASNATDGLFSTPATSVMTTQPYLDIDLGSVQDISSIRVFPAANTVGSQGNLAVPLGFEKAALDLIGFRVYVSATPFAGPDVPVGEGVSVFAPPSSDGVVYDRWNIMTLDSNFNPLPGRYIRLQHPGTDPARINVSQIEVFGDTHSDPPAFPDAVCEPSKAASGYATNTNTGYFYARVWNTVAGGYQNIEERGDLMWSGTNAAQQPTGVTLNGQACMNYQDVRETTIWNNLRIGNTGITNSWDSTSDTTHTVGSYSSIESSTNVGADLELELGSVVKYFVAGASYEYTTGVTSENDSTSFWGNGLQIGGAVGGFDPAFQSLVLTCGYFPHPYAYHLTDRGSVNYQHDLYVVDYVVHQPNTSTVWQRGAVPLACTGQDEIFKDGFGYNSGGQP